MFDEPLKALVQEWSAHDLRLAVIIPAAAGKPNEDGLRRSAYLLALVDGKGHQIVWTGETLSEAVAAAMEWEEDYMAVIPLMGDSLVKVEQSMRALLDKDDPLRDFDKEPA